MAYIPHTEADRREMLATIGVESIDDLFREIPASLRIAPGSLDLPAALDEDRLHGHLDGLSRRNLDATRLTCFLGAGCYDRFIPASVGAVISRGEFLTAYTPYQPELSQGYLQTIYEFQTMVAELFGCDLANASMYDGATAMAEAALLAVHVHDRPRVAVSGAVHPHYRQVLETYCRAMSVEVATAPTEGGRTMVPNLEGASCYIVGYPNFFGVVEELAAAREAAERAGALLVVVADPVACALLKPPGAYGADIVVGEGQPLGVAMGFGGPAVGLFACRQEHVRRIPGRIVGRTGEAEPGPGPARRGYVMTLRTREQDIRRERATSNICTNEALMALANTVYLTAMGKNGLRSVAESSARNARYAMAALVRAGARLEHPEAKVFDEFVLRLPGRDAGDVRDRLLDRGILAGLPLGPYVAGGAELLLVAVTERRTKAEIDAFAAALGEVLA